MTDYMRAGARIALSEFSVLDRYVLRRRFKVEARAIALDITLDFAHSV
ncbi:hypothetical protein [Aquabacter cavernae]|nr:hypothetical protein [Aquabacter cavernae]